MPERYPNERTEENKTSIPENASEPGHWRKRALAAMTGHATSNNPANAARIANEQIVRTAKLIADYCFERYVESDFTTGAG